VTARPIYGQTWAGTPQHRGVSSRRGAGSCGLRCGTLWAPSCARQSVTSVCRPRATACSRAPRVRSRLPSGDDPGSTARRRAAEVRSLLGDVMPERMHSSSQTRPSAGSLLSAAGTVRVLEPTDAADAYVNDLCAHVFLAGIEHRGLRHVHRGAPWVDDARSARRRGQRAGADPVRLEPAGGGAR
jgi:hypothetical protein